MFYYQKFIKYMDLQEEHLLLNPFETGNTPLCGRRLQTSLCKQKKIMKKCIIVSGERQCMYVRKVLRTLDVFLCTLYAPICTLYAPICTLYALLLKNCLKKIIDLSLIVFKSCIFQNFPTRKMSNYDEEGPLYPI